MSQEWYLLKPPHGQLSGFEDEALEDFAQESFNEILDSNLSVEIELCNYDLSICKKMRAIVQKNVQDTRLKALCRELYLPIGTCKAGMYVKYRGRYWIIYGLVDNNGMYEKGIMIICNHLLTWKNSRNEIIQRWANVASASQCNNGETGTRFYDLRTDQLMIILPDDEESLLLNTNNRFIIDKRCKVYEKSMGQVKDCNTDNPVITYVLSRSDSVLFDYQDSGHHQFMVKQDEQHLGDGYYVVGGKGYWLCEKLSDKKHPECSSKVSSSKIEYDVAEVYNGVDPSVFIARFYGESGEELHIAPNWDVSCDFKDRLNIKRIDNAIYISVDDKSLINKSFELFLNADGYETSKLTVYIRSFI